MSSLTKFRGVLLSSLVGDCFGELYEGTRTLIPFPLICERLDLYISKEETKELTYTDDTQMTLSICKSLKTMNGFNAENMGKTFAEDFFVCNHKRGYGPSIGEVFVRMRDSGYQDIFKPAELQIGGKGSYGNGGAMRISPIPLFGFAMNDQDLQALVTKVTRLTHTNPLGELGAQLQAAAIYEILHQKCEDTSPLDVKGLMLRIKGRIMNMLYSEDSKKVYIDALDVISGLVKEKDFSPKKVVAKLGNDIKAHTSVPTALYIFLRAQKPVAGIPYDNIFLRCLVMAISIGGDTDTIATMACALVGAQVGDVGIPEGLLSCCEAKDLTIENARMLFDFVRIEA